MSWILAADLAGPKVQRLYELSHKVLAVSVPVALLAPETSMPARAADYTSAVAIPFHSHVAMNCLVTDYVPLAVWGPSRAVLLGMSVVTGAGLLKMTGHGCGLSGALKTLWRKD